MNEIVFVFNNKKFKISNRNDNHNSYLICFYTPHHAVEWWLNTHRVFNKTKYFDMHIDSIFIELLTASNLFEYKQVNGKYYTFEFNNVAKLQLI